MADPAAGPPQSSASFTLPLWVVQLVPIILIVAAAVTAYAATRSDVEQAKTAIVEIKAVQARAPASFVPRETFDIKVKEQEDSLARIEKTTERLENLVQGLYERLPPKK